MSVIIKKYSPDLIKRFNQEEYRLSMLLPTNIKIEHVGSSAVFIGGKNIVDILIGVPTRKDMISIKNILIKNGYFERNDSHEDRIFFGKYTRRDWRG